MDIAVMAMSIAAAEMIRTVADSINYLQNMINT